MASRPLLESCAVALLGLLLLGAGQHSAIQRSERTPRGVSYGVADGTVGVRYLVLEDAACGGTWDDTDCWSLQSGGSGGASAPTATENCILDFNSCTSGSCTLDLNLADRACYELDFNQPRDITIAFGSQVLTCTVNCLFDSEAGGMVVTASAGTAGITWANRLDLRGLDLSTVGGSLNFELTGLHGEITYDDTFARPPRMRNLTLPDAANLLWRVDGYVASGRGIELDRIVTVGGGTGTASMDINESAASGSGFAINFNHQTAPANPISGALFNQGMDLVEFDYSGAATIPITGSDFTNTGLTMDFQGNTDIARPEWTLDAFTGSAMRIKAGAQVTATAAVTLSGNLDVGLAPAHVTTPVVAEMNIQAAFDVGGDIRMGSGGREGHLLLTATGAVTADKVVIGEEEATLSNRIGGAAGATITLSEATPSCGTTIRVISPGSGGVDDASCGAVADECATIDGAIVNNGGSIAADTCIVVDGGETVDYIAAPGACSDTYDGALTSAIGQYGAGTATIDMSNCTSGNLDLDGGANDELGIYGPLVLSW